MFAASCAGSGRVWPIAFSPRRAATATTSAELRIHVWTLGWSRNSVRLCAAAVPLTHSRYSTPTSDQGALLRSRRFRFDPSVPGGDRRSWPKPPYVGVDLTVSNVDSCDGKHPIALRW